MAIQLLSLGFGLWGNRWGAPARWHGDEMYDSAEQMLNARTLDPQHYPYGELHYYTIALAAVVPARLYARSFDPRPAQRGTLADSLWARASQVRIMRAARAVSAIYATLLVGLTCWLGGLAFGYDTALLAAAFLSVSPYLVTIAHFATVDAAADFWYWAACAAGFRHMKDGRRPWLLVAALLAGLAVGLKADRLVVVAPLLAAFTLARPRAPVRLLAGAALLLPVGFVLANPSIITATLRYVDGYTRDLWFNSLRSPEPHPYAALLRDFGNGLTWPVFALATIGAGYGAFRLWRRGERPTVVWFATASLPYALLLGVNNLPWYVPMLFPPLLLLGAFGCMAMLRRLTRGLARGGWVGVAGILAWSVYGSGRVVSQFANDARDAAGRWIVAHVPPGSSILVAGYGPAFPIGRYQVRQPTRMELCPNAIEPRARLEASRRYQAFRESLFELARWLSAHVGTRVPQGRYHAWFDWYTERCEAPRTDDPDPDYVVVVGHAQVQELPPERLRAPPYHLVKHFEYPNRGVSGPYMDFVNPTVDVYTRDSSGGTPVRVSSRRRARSSSRATRDSS